MCTLLHAYMYMCVACVYVRTNASAHMNVYMRVAYV